MKTTSVRFFALIAVLGVAACGDDPVAATGDELSEAELQDLTEVLVGAAFNLGATQPAPVDGPQPVAFSFTGAVEEAVTCPLGGEVALNGSATVTGDDETEEFTAAYEVAAAHQGCVVQAESGREFTLDSELDLTFSAESTGPGNVSWDGSFGGSVAWASDERSGTCTVTYAFSGSVADEGIAASVEGAICGNSITREFTYGGV